MMFYSMLWNCPLSNLDSSSLLLLQILCLHVYLEGCIFLYGPLSIFQAKCKILCLLDDMVVSQSLIWVLQTHHLLLESMTDCLTSTTWQQAMKGETLFEAWPLFDMSGQKVRNRRGWTSNRSVCSITATHWSPGPSVGKSTEFGFLINCLFILTVLMFTSSHFLKFFFLCPFVHATN